MPVVIFFFKQKTAYEIGVRLVGSEMCIRDSPWPGRGDAAWHTAVGPVHGRRDLRSGVAGPDHCVPAAKPAAVLRVVVPPGLLRHGTNPATRRFQGEPKPSSGFGK